MLLSTETYVFLLIKNDYDCAYSDFSATVESDNDKPLLSEGDIILVKKQDSVNHDEIGVFLIDGIRMVKRMYFQNGDIGLKSLDSNCDDVNIEKVHDLTCEGKVVKMLHPGECKFEKIENPTPYGS